jgi:agmatine deiminase
MTDASGRPFKTITLPTPGTVGGLSTAARDLERLPASYANFYIANSVVLAPVFGHANDARAVETLQKLFFTRRVVPINCEPLVWGMGTIHCVTQQQPRSSAFIRG